jgi:hypothetical protein
MRGILKKLILPLLLVGLLAAEEYSLGGVALGDSFDSVVKKYAFAGRKTAQEKTGLPYPLNVGNKSQVSLVQDRNSRIYFYFDEYKKVLAVGLFADNEYADNKIYETSAGLRQTDGLLEMKVVYGSPLDISEFDFKDAFGDRVVRRLYYYPDLIIQTRRINNLPEQIDNIIVCKYNMAHVLLEKDSPLAKPKR